MSGLGNNTSQLSDLRQGGDVFSNNFGAPSLNKKTPIELALYALIVLVVAFVAIKIYG